MVRSGIIFMCAVFLLHSCKNVLHNRLKESALECIKSECTDEELLVLGAAKKNAPAILNKMQVDRFNDYYIVSVIINDSISHESQWLAFLLDKQTRVLAAAARYTRSKYYSDFSFTYKDLDHNGTSELIAYSTYRSNCYKYAEMEVFFEINGKLRNITLIPKYASCSLAEGFTAELKTEEYNFSNSDTLYVMQKEGLGKSGEAYENYIIDTILKSKKYKIIWDNQNSCYSITDEMILN